LASAAFEEVRDRAGAERIPLEGAVDRGTEFLRPVVIEQREEPCRVHAERFALRGEALKQGGRQRHRESEPVTGTGRIVLTRGLRRGPGAGSIGALPQRRRFRWLVLPRSTVIAIWAPLRDGESARGALPVHHRDHQPLQRARGIVGPASVHRPT
jgi:hypothetical protein